MSRSATLPVGRGLTYIALAATAWGTGGAIVVVITRHATLDPFTISFWRFLIGALALAVVLRRRRSATGAKAASTRRRLRLLVVGVALTVFQTSYFAAIPSAGVAMATILVLGAGPIVIMIGARVLFGERLGLVGYAIVGVALLALALMLGGDAAASVPAEGLAYSALSIAGYATSTLLNRAGGTTGAGDPLESTAAGLVVGAVGLAPFAATTAVVPAVADVWWVFALLAYLGLVVGAAGYWLFFRGLRVVRAGTASMIVLVEPLVATVIAVLLLGEELTGRALAGTVLLLGAVGFLTWREHRMSAAAG